MVLVSLQGDLSVYMCNCGLIDAISPGLHAFFDQYSIGVFEFRAKRLEREMERKEEGRANQLAPKKLLLKGSGQAM